MKFDGGDTNFYVYVANDPINYIDPDGLLKWETIMNFLDPTGLSTQSGLINGEIDLGERYGKSAMEFYADITTDPNATWYEKSGAYVGGVFAALWTPETSDKTFTTLASAYALAQAVKRNPVKPDPCNSFVAGTMVETPNGLKPIEEIRVGDQVFSWDEESGQIVSAMVLETMSHWVDELLDIDVNGHIFTCTSEHPFYVFGSGWISASNLIPGMFIGDQQNEKRVQINSIVFHNISVKVYNIEVQNYHNYYITTIDGGSMVCVHNACDRYKKPKKGSGKEKADDVPSWAKGNRPRIDENGKKFSNRLMNEKFGEGNWSPKTHEEYKQIQKWGDRGFE